jgi:exo-beta-1,3-glucanase (GH17 family)
VVVVSEQAGGDRRLDGKPLQRVVRALSAGAESAHATFRRPTRSRRICKRLQGKVRRSGPIRRAKPETAPQRAGKYGLKVWHGAWLNNNEKENLEQINLLIDHANKYKDTVERVIVGNEVLLRKDLTANELRRYIRQVKQRVSQPVTYADVWEFWMRNPSLADEVDFITIHILPYWEDEPIGSTAASRTASRASRSTSSTSTRRSGALPRQEDRDRRDGWPSDGRMR